MSRAQKLLEDNGEARAACCQAIQDLSSMIYDGKLDIMGRKFNVSRVDKMSMRLMGLRGGHWVVSAALKDAGVLSLKNPNSPRVVQRFQVNNGELKEA